jgi:hypothetical protein
MQMKVPLQLKRKFFQLSQLSQSSRSHLMKMAMSNLMRTIPMQSSVAHSRPLLAIGM